VKYVLAIIIEQIIDLYNYLVAQYRNLVSHLAIAVNKIYD